MDNQKGKHAKADHGRDFHPIVNHKSKLRNFTKGEIREFQRFHFHFNKFCRQNSIIYCLMISQNKTIYKSCTYEHVVVHTM